MTLKIERPAFYSVTRSGVWTVDEFESWFTTHVEPINKLLSEGVEVVGYIKPGRIWQEKEYHDDTVTHKALLINIQPIKQETAEELTAWKEQAEKLAGVLLRIGFCTLRESRKPSIKGHDCLFCNTLTAFNEFKSLQSGNKAPESAQETGESDRTVMKEREG